MKTIRRIFFSISFIPLAALSQSIPIKTVPVATGDQFLIFPSRTLSMGGISIAVEDELSDPFENPAKGIRIDGIKVVSAPVYYSVSVQRGSSYDGSGFSFPLGLLFKAQSFFGGLYLARQSIGSDYRSSSIVTVPAASSGTPYGEPATKTNTYSFALAGTTIPGTNIAVAASGSWADLNSIEGVQLLYPTTPNVKQDGSASEYRLALLSEIHEGEFLDVTLLRSDFEMRYDVPEPQPILWDARASQPMTVRTDRDETSLWGFRVGYVKPLIGTWRVGAQVTANWKSHPKIPNYKLMNIPRDPGNSTAYNVGVGLSTTKDQSLFGFDFIYEPIRTQTWAEAEGPTTRRNSTVLPAGAKTIENFFEFSNWILRSGFRASNGKTEIQGGVRLHAIKYDLHQIDHINLSKREQKESWAEWTLSLGLGYNLPGIRLQYTGLLTLGTGQPGTFSGVSIVRTTAEYAADFLPAPNGILNLRDAWVFTHQISLVVDLQ